MGEGGTAIARPHLVMLAPTRRRAKLKHPCPPKVFRFWIRCCSQLVQTLRPSSSFPKSAVVRTRPSSSMSVITKSISWDLTDALQTGTEGLALGDHDRGLGNSELAGQTPLTPEHVKQR